MTDPVITDEMKAALKRAAQIPNTPTDLTYECRKAVSGRGPRAYDWTDKPHRLVFDLSREVERLTADLAEKDRRIAELERERDDATGTLRYCEKQWGDERGVMIDKFVYERGRAEAAAARAEAVERELSEIADHMESECDSDSILHVVREAEADRDIYKARAQSAEAEAPASAMTCGQRLA